MSLEPQRRTCPPCQLLVGTPPKGCKASTVILIGRRYRSKWWTVVCFGQKSHYRADGACEHTDAVLANLNTDVVPRERIRVLDGRKEADHAG